MVGWAPPLLPLGKRVGPWGVHKAHSVPGSGALQAKNARAVSRPLPHQMTSRVSQRQNNFLHVQFPTRTSQRQSRKGPFLFQFVFFCNCFFDVLAAASLAMKICRCRVDEVCITATGFAQGCAQSVFRKFLHFFPGIVQNFTHVISNKLTCPGMLYKCSVRS